MKTIYRVYKMNSSTHIVSRSKPYTVEMNLNKLICPENADYTRHWDFETLDDAKNFFFSIKDRSDIRIVATMVGREIILEYYEVVEVEIDDDEYEMDTDVWETSMQSLDDVRRALWPEDDEDENEDDEEEDDE